MNNSTHLSSFVNMTCYCAPFSTQDWLALDKIIDNILTNSTDILETSKVGDSRNEYVDVRVARFIIRKDGHSTITNHAHTAAILNIFESANFIRLVEKQTGCSNLSILRMQLNSMKAGGFVGVHTDTEQDCNYKVTALIRTTSCYSGGGLRVYGNNPTTIHQANHTVFLMDPTLEHEVKKVKSGLRNSLLVLFGKS